MGKYILKRLLWVIPVMIGVVAIVYTIGYHMPGSPPISSRRAAALGLDRPYLVQLGTYIWDVFVRMDLGRSWLTNVPLADELATRIPVTLNLSLLGILLMVAVGLPCGMVSALKQYSALDIGLTSVSLVMAAIPSFVLALLSAWVFGVVLRWVPVTGLGSWKSWIFPVICSAGGGVAVYIRMARTTMLEVIRQDYIRTARAKGMRERDVVRKHALRNCMIPLATVIGLFASAVLSGSIIIEAIFNIQGMGLYLMDGIMSRDYPVVNGVVVTISLLVCLVNLLVDIAYAFIDPRIQTALAD